MDGHLWAEPPGAGGAFQREQRRAGGASLRGWRHVRAELPTLGFLPGVVRLPSSSMAKGEEKDDMWAPHVMDR
jgi:hypothetical protein